jgi:thiamine biosynthesis lipoprotein
MPDPNLSRAVAVARAAMATRFEIVLPGDNEVRLRAAGEAALDEIEHLEAQLSFYRPESELSRVNRRAATEPVRVEPQFFQLLERAREIHQLTEGSFDPTIAPLMRCWGFVGAEGRMPDPEQLEKARAVTGMHLVQLDRANRSVRFERAGVMLDLGAIGKGYAIERAVEILHDLGIENAIIHGGTSTVYAFGQSPEAGEWKVAIPQPHLAGGCALESSSTNVPRSPLAVVSLRDRAISVSAVWGKAFEFEGKVYGHVFDPRLGRPVAGALMAATVTASATDADACSTALLVLGAQGLDLFSRKNPTTDMLVVEPGTTLAPWKVSTRGIALEPHEDARSGSPDEVA